VKKECYEDGQPSGIQRRVVSLKYTDVSEMRASSIISVIMETVCACETSVYFSESADLTTGARSRAEAKDFSSSQCSDQL
jgi:hypothetical protein